MKCLTTTQMEVLTYRSKGSFIPHNSLCSAQIVLYCQWYLNIFDINNVIETFNTLENYKYILMSPDVPTPYRRTLLLDDKGDLLFDGSGKISMTKTDADKREQDINIYLKTVIGEDIFATGMGLDLMAVKENPFNPSRIDYEIRKTLTQYRGRHDRPNRIKNIDSISVSDPDADRVVRVDVNLTTDTNTVSILGVNI